MRTLDTWEPPLVWGLHFALMLLGFALATIALWVLSRHWFLER